MKLELDLYYDGDIQINKGNHVEFEIRCGEIDKRTSIYMTDFCDNVEGWFRNKEDVIKLRDKLNEIIEFI